jgi:plasmid stabilization system protein ParE
MFKLKFSEQINEDIVSSITYIRETLEAPMAAQKHSNELIKKYELLKTNPFIMPLVNDYYLASIGIRCMLVKKYLLFYKINSEANEVYLYRFLHSKQDWIRILGIFRM